MNDQINRSSPYVTKSRPNSKSPIFLKLMSINPIIELVNHPKYFWPLMAGLAVAAASNSEASNKMNFFVSWPIGKPFSHGENLCKSKLFHQVTDWDRTNWPIGSQNRAQKWFDFDETWYLELLHFKPKTHQFLSKSNNFSIIWGKNCQSKVVRFQ